MCDTDCQVLVIMCSVPDSYNIGDSSHTSRMQHFAVFIQYAFYPYQSVGFDNKCASTVRFDMPLRLADLRDASLES